MEILKRTSYNKMMRKVAVLVMLFFVALSSAQENLTVDELYAKARATAFEDKNYKEAITLTKQTLVKSPDYTELSVFLGKLYTWDNQHENARTTFTNVLQKHPGLEDASLAYGNLEYWNKNNKKAMEIVQAGIDKNPESQDLLLLKSKILLELKQYTQAHAALNKILELNPKHTGARALSQDMATVSAKNAIGVRYDYVYFDKRFDDPWHLASVDYTRQSKLGTAVAKINYADRFANSAFQFEVDLYPRLSKMFYAYINAGVSDDSEIFPQYRAGFSLHANLPAAFEADAGFRVLSFAQDDTWFYTASVGKYYSNFWFNFRAYITPDNNDIAQSYILQTRYFFGGADDYFGLRAGTGISPDNKTNNVLYTGTYKLKSNNITLEYRTTINTTNVVFIQAALESQEYAKDTKGNQISAGIGYIKRF